MPLYKGTTEIASGKLYKGTTEIENVYKGASMIYQNSISFNSNFLIAGGGAAGGRSTYNYYNNTSENYDEYFYYAGGGSGGVRTSFSGATPVTNGGGQALDSQLSLQTNTAYSIVVGAKGTGTSSGGETSVASLIAVGGGSTSASSYTSHGIITTPANGGGGGGATIGYTGSGNQYYLSNQPVFSSGTYGFNGGGSSTLGRSGGGGGAGSVASNSTVTISSYAAMRAGGSGITSSITGSSATYGIGGNGVYSYGNLFAGSGRPAVTAPGSGGHGGGTENYNRWNSGGYGSYLGPTNGTDGCIILRFPNTRNYTATGSPTLTTDGSDKILQWTTAGTYTITFT